MDRPDAFVGTNVFVLFDTSNFMYRGFVYAEDAIADFVRGLDRADSVAVYTFSRNLSRAASLTRDHGDAISGLRNSVAGDDTALYNALLLTLRDAAKVPGRKVVIVFSNGPDNASMVAPDDVRAVAEDEGIPIYVISTNEVNKDPISSGVLPPHRAAHRRQGLLGAHLAEAGGGVRGHPRGHEQLVHHDLLSGGQPQRRLPQDRGGDRQRPRQEVPCALAAGVSAEPVVVGARWTGRSVTGYPLACPLGLAVRRTPNQHEAPPSPAQRAPRQGAVADARSFAWRACASEPRNPESA